MAEQRPTKRSRTDDSTTETPILKRGDPWLDDGNVVLQAGSTEFRVHRTVLSAYSPIFKDMFMLCDPSGDDVVEGCPLVQLSDTADDLHHVLKAIFDRGYHFSDREPQPISVIAAFMRLGQKYEIHQLRSEAVSRLTAIFPTTLGEYDQISNNKSSIVTGIYNVGSLFIVINLARECNLPSVLPAAMYACSRGVSAKDILRGVLHGGTRRIMSPADQTACITGWFTLVEKQATKTLKWLDPNENFAGCHNLQACDRLRKSIFHYFWHPMPKLASFLCWDSQVSLCKFCYDKSMEINNAGRQSIWDELPSIYDLPEWEDLRKQQ